MTRLKYLSIFACFSLLLVAIACGSSNSNGSPGAGGSAAGGVGGAAATGWDEARVGDSGTKWTVNARKGAYFFFAKVGPSYNDTTTDHTVRNLAIAFTQAAVAKLKSGSPAPATLVPSVSEIPSVPGGVAWTLDPSQTETMNGPAVATDETDAVNLVDGGAASFYITGKYSAVAMAWEKWVNGDDNYDIDLQVWQMASVADATQVYTDLLSNSLYSNLTWVNCKDTDPANPCPTP